MEHNDAPTHHRIGDYELLEKVGEGHYSTVFRARSTTIPREVALKVVTMGRVRKSSAAMVRATQTVEQIARLQHPHLINVVEAFEFNRNRLVVVTDFVDGPTLSDLMDDLSADALVTVLQQVASALELAHSNGIVHGDLRPSNIFLQEPAPAASAPDRRATVADFGIIDTVSRQSGRIIARPEFSAPEVASGGEPNAASDVFSLGAIAYAAMTGDAPFASSSVAGSLQRHLDWDRPDLSGCDGYDPRLCDLVEQMLDPRENYRIKEMSSVVEALEEIRPSTTLLSPELTSDNDRKEKVWVERGVVHILEEGSVEPRRLEFDGANAIDAVSLRDAVAFSTDKNELWLIRDGGATSTFSVSGLPTELRVELDGARLVVVTDIGRSYEANHHEWRMRQRLDPLPRTSLDLQHPPAEGE